MPVVPNSNSYWVDARGMVKWHPCISINLQILSLSLLFQEPKCLEHGDTWSRGRNLSAAGGASIVDRNLNFSISSQGPPVPRI